MHSPSSEGVCWGAEAWLRAWLAVFSVGGDKVVAPSRMPIVGVGGRSNNEGQSGSAMRQSGEAARV